MSYKVISRKTFANMAEHLDEHAAYDHYFDQYHLETCLGCRLTAHVETVEWDETPLLQIVARRILIFGGRSLTGAPEVEQCITYERNADTAGGRFIRDIITSIVDGYLKSVHEDYVREQIESGDSTEDELKDLYADCVAYIH